MTPHELLTKNTRSLVWDSNKIGKHTQVIKTSVKFEMGCTVLFWGGVLWQPTFTEQSEQLMSRDGMVNKKCCVIYLKCILSVRISTNSRNLTDYIACAKQEICTIIWISVFYVDKTHFLRPSHIFS